jgi:hypothetical protein
MAGKKKKSPKRFGAVKVVKEMSRERIGRVPSSRVVPDRKKESTEKHKPKLTDFLSEE